MFYLLCTDCYVRKTPGLAGTWTIDVRSGALVVRLDITTDQACLKRNLTASSSQM